MRRFLNAFAIVLAATTLSYPSLAQDSGANIPASTPQEGETGLLYIFNDSGPTLIPGKQVVTDNGARLVSLPRRTYAMVRLAPGPHLLKPNPPLWKQQVQLSVVAGSSYYVVIAYRPERSWALPFAGTPLVLKEITAEQAAPLLAKMKLQATSVNQVPREPQVAQ